MALRRSLAVLGVATAVLVFVAITGVPQGFIPTEGTTPEWRSANPEGTVHDVRDYGAVGDGRHDDTAAVQAALDAVRTGESVYLPTGTYALRSVTLKDRRGVTIFGAGPRSRIVSGAGQIIELRDVDGLELRDLAIEGDYDRSDAIGIRMAAVRNSRFEDLVLRNIGFSAIFGVATDTAFSDLQIRHVGDFGLQTKPGSARVVVQDSRFADFASRKYPAHAIYFEGTEAPVARGNHITGVADAPGRYEVSGIKVTDGLGGLIENNLVEDSVAAVSLPHATAVVVRNNVARNMKERGFYILAGSSACRLEGNRVESAPVGFASGEAGPDSRQISFENNVTVDVRVPASLPHIVNARLVNNSWQGAAQ